MWHHHFDVGISESRSRLNGMIIRLLCYIESTTFFVNLSRLRRESRLNIISKVYLAALTLTIYYVCCILVARLPITLSSTALRQELKKRGEHSVDNVMISARHM